MITHRGVMYLRKQGKDKVGIPAWGLIDESALYFLAINNYWGWVTNEQNVC